VVPRTPKASMTNWQAKSVQAWGEKSRRQRQL